MKAYSIDLRERVVRAVEEGRLREEIMHLFGVSRATIKRYAKQHRETGDLVPNRFQVGQPAKEMPYEQTCGASWKPIEMRPWKNTARFGKPRMGNE